MVRALRSSTRFGDAYLVGVDSGENTFAFREGLYDQAYRVAPCADPEYWEQIEHVARQHGLQGAVVVPEREVWAWSHRRDTTDPLPTLIPGPSFAAIAGDKSQLFAVLADSGHVPESVVVDTEGLASVLAQRCGKRPQWMRPHHFGASSGTGALAIDDPEKGLAWACLNPQVQSWQVADLLSGRNIAVTMLYMRGHLHRLAMYERLEYFMAHVSPSGITGNISKGRLFYESGIAAQAQGIIRTVEAAAGELADGLITIDAIVEGDERVVVTEVNMRPTACISAYAIAGYDIASDWVAMTLGQDLGPDSHGVFPETNVLRRDIDGLPQWSPHDDAVPSVSL